MVTLGLCGSLRRGSHNRRLLEAAAANLPSGETLDVFEGLTEIPPYNADHDNADSAAPQAVTALREAIATADAIVIATPEYNSSVPGHLKNALDWASRPFPDNVLRNKPVAVIGASTGLFGAVWAQADLRKILTRIGADVVDEELPVGQAHDAFTEDNSLTDPDLASTLTDIIGALLHKVRTGAKQPAT